MPDNYEHYITRNMKAFYKKRLFSPIIYLLLLAILCVVVSHLTLDELGHLHLLFAIEGIGVGCSLLALLTTTGAEDAAGATSGRIASRFSSWTPEMSEK